MFVQEGKKLRVAIFGDNLPKRTFWVLDVILWCGDQPKWTSLSLRSLLFFFFFNPATMLLKSSLILKYNI